MNYYVGLRVATVFLIRNTFVGLYGPNLKTVTVSFSSKVTFIHLVPTDARALMYRMSRVRVTGADVSASVSKAILTFFTRYGASSSSVISIRLSRWKRVLLE